jgi:hypothetical protein
VSGLARPLWGRDDELDVLIERSAGEDFARWIDVTERIGAELRSRFQAGVPSRVMQDVTDVILSLHGKDAHGRV